MVSKAKNCIFFPIILKKQVDLKFGKRADYLGRLNYYKYNFQIYKFMELLQIHFGV